MRNYKLHPKARNDLDRIWDHTSEYWGRAQAREYFGKIQHACDLIASNPHIGRPRDEALVGLQVFIVEEHMICYCIDNNHIEVLRILHNRTDVESRMS